MYEEFTWNNDKHEPMMIEIKHHGQVVFRFFMGEAMENAGRKRVMQHVRECDHSPWLREWHEAAQADMIATLSNKQTDDDYDRTG